MCDDILMGKILYDCPICEKQHEIEHRQRFTQALYKDKIVDYVETYYICLEYDDENEFVPAYIMDENLSKVREAYQKKYNNNIEDK